MLLFIPGFRDSLQQLFYINILLSHLLLLFTCIIARFVKCSCYFSNNPLIIAYFEKLLLIKLQVKVACCLRFWDLDIETRYVKTDVRKLS